MRTKWLLCVGDEGGGEKRQTRLRDATDFKVAAVVVCSANQGSDLLEAAVEGETAGEHNVDHNTKRPHVARLRVRLAVEHLWRSILQSAAARPHQLATTVQLREPKVGDHHMEILFLVRAQNVFRLLFTSK